MRILFDSKLSQFKTPFGTLQENETCTFHILIPFAKQLDDTLYDTWGGEMAVCEAGLYFYYFHITTQDGAFRLFKQGQSDTNMEAGGLWQLSVLADKYPVPAGCAGAVMYQIFPDRFCQSGSCDLTGKITPYWVHENKDDVPVYLPDANGEVLNNDFYGGNLNGIREKLPYLQELGVEILYLNPIFYAWSTHRYDTCDYKRIDPMLGTEEDFRALCAEAHAHGMKVILDGVFSHVGSRSAYFQQAIHDPSSPYRGWFRFQHYPDVYDSWWGITTLPCVDKMNPDFIRYMIDDEDSVAVHWLKLGADGWRLDVVDELPDAFLARLRARIRAYKPDALLIGEVWEDASNKIAYDQRRHPLHARHAARDQRHSRPARRRSDGPCPAAFHAGAAARGQAAPQAGSLPAVHAAGHALHLLRRRSWDDRLPGPIQPEILSLGQGRRKFSLVLSLAGPREKKCARAAQRDRPRAGGRRRPAPAAAAVGGGQRRSLLQPVAGTLDAAAQRHDPAWRRDHGIRR